MLPRARQRLAQQGQAEGGFILIEVLVSALILAIVAGAVLALISATTHSAASERAHSVAYGIAQKEQARMRTMRISALKELPGTPRKVTAGGTNFTVESRGKFVNSTTGISSCSGEGASADYVEITSTVSSSSLLNPVSIHSIVSPSNGSLDPSHGTFAFQAKNAAGEPLSNVSITATGAGNFNGFTDENGCATFADVPAGNYQVTTSAAGRINPQGLETATLEVNVEASATQQKTFYFDRPGTIKASFYYKEPNGTEPTAAVDSMVLFDTENEPEALTVWTSEHALVTAPLTSAKVYPFKTTPYSVYAGSCISNSPDAKNEGINPTAIAKIPVTGGSFTERRIQVPALNAVVTLEGNKLEGATVVATDKSCQYNTVNVARTFTTDKVGHIATSTAVSTEAIGLPYGEYTVCASAPFTRKSGGHTITEYHRVEKTISVKSLGSPALQKLELSTSGSSSGC
jgi:type II secretory pathway pseudopilin PulG